MSKGVLHILDARYVFKVGNGVIGFIFVLVIDFSAVWKSNKMTHYKVMYLEIFTLSIVV